MSESSAHQSRQGRISGNLFGVGSMVAWAAGFPAVEALMQDFDLPTVMTGRFAMALAVLLPVWLLSEGWPALLRARWGRGLWIGGLGIGMGAAGVLVSQALTDPVTAAIFAAATPLCASVVDWVWLRRRFTPKFFAGLGAAVVGGIVATGGGVPGSIGLGALAGLVSGLFFAWGSMALNRDLADHSVVARTTISAAGVLLVMVAVLAVSMALGRSALPEAAFSLRNLALFAVYGTLAFSVSQFFWVAATDKLGVTLASFHINAAPFYTMLILLALGGGWSWPQAIGAAIVGAGVVVAQR